MNRHMRVVIVLGLSLVLAFLIAEANHYLSPFQVHIFAGGLLITFPLLRFRFTQGLAVACLLGLIHDATAPVAPGVHLLAFAALYTVVFSVRSRFHREQTGSSVLVALGLNTALFLGFSLMHSPEIAPAGLYWQRVLTDFAVSQTFILVAGAWFFSLQIHALRYFGIHIEKEQRQAR